MLLILKLHHSAWLHPKDMSTLQRHEIEGFLADEAKKRGGELREGYRIALDPHNWMADLLKKRADAAAQLQEEEVDQLESENDHGDDSSSTKKTKSTKKRKRDSDEEPVKPKKAPKAKKGSAEPSKKKSSSTTSKTKKNGIKSKAVVESEDEGGHAEAEGEDDEAEESKKKSPPPTKKAKRDKDDDGDECEPFVDTIFFRFGKANNLICTISQRRIQGILSLSRSEIGGTDYRKRSSATKLCPNLKLATSLICAAVADRVP